MGYYQYPTRNAEGNGECTMTEITIGDHVSIPSHARGTVWESGWVQDIDQRGALIKYGARGDTGLYGTGRYVPLGELVKLEG